MEPGTGLRAITRNAVRVQIARTAEDLFLSRGYEETTIDQIASAVGISQRSVFRYFPSKEDILLDHYDSLGQQLLERLTARPDTENDWTALRRAFDLAIDQFAEPGRRAHGTAIQRLLDRSPHLLAAYLRRVDGVQQQMTARLAERAERQGRTVDPVVLRATVGAAFACLQAAVFQACGDEPAAQHVLLDRVMNAVHVTVPAPARRG
ncbi:TetR/AcrR family transcriptional regulator [Streptomyces sp. DSM 44915]|uniref:TetR/AcrR family transcriptional regulator n=1 Tax=Streptomyces chisholmiae TaxID=3075540 RepID=A0ABU2JRW0_9ACTN|nr:TetR/AcrR family transcriptional regulator [Streptomyces sp. DSM 44915]MDT0267702.1 TetR/AcrR family transcriptional regulator [Streptomyces sp. DSM 44915]